ncbi:MAG: DVU_1551 family NTP transferase [Sedimentibacter sp.]|uniref:DVU_1551 family NTP transferase n=1 Tax=Sedimentibacter sp. TaxID=1960295 RepID=UPI0031584D09
MESGIIQKHGRIGAVIVAGGMSSRMKDFKPLMQVGDTTMIENVINNFRSLGIVDIVVVTGYKSEEIKKKLSDCNVSFVVNKQYEKNHMFDSICLGIRSLAPAVEMAFLSPADSPFVQRFTLMKMVEEIEEGKHCLIQPSFDGKDGHPLLLTKKALSHVLKHDGTMGLQGVISKMGNDFMNMSVVDPGIILDADTANDYLKLIEYNESRKCPSMELCKKIQDYFHMPDEVMAHSSKVAIVASDLSRLLCKKGIKLNTNVILAAGMLHDIEGGKPEHARKGGELLSHMGYEQVSQIVREHMVLDSISDVPTEKEVVFLADKMVKGEKLVNIEERFAAKEEKYKDNQAALQSIKLRKKQAYEIYHAIFGL